MFRKPSPIHTLPAFAALAAIGAALSFAVPGPAEAAKPPSDSALPVCSARITDNCIQHERGSNWYRDHHRATLHHTAWKHKVTARRHVARAVHRSHVVHHRTVTKPATKG